MKVGHGQDPNSIYETVPLLCLQVLGCTLPETNSSHLPGSHPKRKIIFQPSIFRGEYVGFREGISSTLQRPCSGRDSEGIMNWILLLAHVHIPSSSCRGVVDRWAHILIPTYTTNKHQQTIHDNTCLVVYLDLLGNGGWKKSDKHIPQMVVSSMVILPWSNPLKHHLQERNVYCCNKCWPDVFWKRSRIPTNQFFWGRWFPSRIAAVERFKTSPQRCFCCNNKKHRSWKNLTWFRAKQQHELYLFEVDSSFSNW